MDMYIQEWKIEINTKKACDLYKPTDGIENSVTILPKMIHK